MSNKKLSADGALWKKKAQEKEWLDLVFKRQPTKGYLPGIAAESAKDLILGAAAGSYVGTTVFGKYSFWAGLAATIAGHATGWTSASSFGVGMMACGGKSIVGVNGIDDLNGFSMEAMKARHKSFIETWKEKLAPGMPKFGKADNEDKAVAGVKVFHYPQTDEKVNLSELDKLEAQLMQSARQYEQSKTAYVNGFGELEFSDRIY